MNSQYVSRYTGYLIRRAQQAHVAAWQREVSNDVTSVQFGVLSMLHVNPGASQRDLCIDLDLDRSTIADIVARLEKRGLLARVRDEADRRRNVLLLTAAGQKEFADLEPRVSRVDHVLTDGLSASDRSEVRRILLEMLESPTIRSLGGGAAS